MSHRHIPIIKKSEIIDSIDGEVIGFGSFKNKWFCALCGIPLRCAWRHKVYKPKVAFYKKCMCCDKEFKTKWKQVRRCTDCKYRDRNKLDGELT